MMESGIMPVMDMNRNGYGNGYDGGYWMFLLLFAMMGGGNWNRNECVTPTQLQNGFDTTQIMGKLDGLQQTVTSGLCDGFYAQNTNVLNGFASAQNTMAQGYAGLNTAIGNNGYETRGAINELGYQLKDCCCTTNRNIDAVRFENSQNTCKIVDAIKADGEATRALITKTEIQSLRDQLAEARGIISNTRQTADIVRQLTPAA